MGIDAIYDGYVTLDELYMLNEAFGIEFVIEDGQVTEVIC